VEKNEILDHLIDIKERISAMEAKQDAFLNLESRMHEIEAEVVRQRTTIKVLQWVAGISVAMFAAIVKVWKN
jgi:hypothetical protein